MNRPEVIEGPDISLDEDLSSLVESGTMDQWQAISVQSLRNTELIAEKLAKGGDSANSPVPLTVKTRKRRTSL